MGLAIPPSSVTSKRSFCCSGNVVCHCNVVVPIRASLEAEICHGVSAQKCGNDGIKVRNFVSNIAIFGLDISNIAISISLGYRTVLLLGGV